MSQCQASPVQKRGQDSTVTPDSVDTADQEQTEGDSAREVVDADKLVSDSCQRSTHDGSHAVPDVENTVAATSNYEADKSRSLPSDQGTGKF